MVDAALAVDVVSGRILVANEQARRLFAEPGADLVGASIISIFPGQAPALTVFTEAVIHKGSYWTRSLAPLRADRTKVHVECIGTRLLTEPDPSILLTVYDLDLRHRRDLDAEAEDYVRGGIAEWRRTERLFQEIERSNQLILRAAGEGIFGVNAEGKTTFVNPAAEAMLGWETGELIGRDMHASVHHHRPDGTHYPHQECPIYAAFRDGAVHHVENEKFFRKDGSGFWVEYTSTPIRDRGRLAGAVIIFRDISQRHEADERLRAALAEVDMLRERLQRENAYLQEEMRLERNHRGVVGRSGAIQKILSQVELVARTDAAVLVTGESGTGKELIASAIHEASQRNDRPLIRVNCAAIPRELFESEFFGHVKGAFTGALRDRLGRFELADGGTLFSTRSARSRSNSRASCCVCCRRASSSASAKSAPAMSMSASSPPRTRICGARSAKAASARIFISGSTSSRSFPRRCASGSRTSRSWRCIFSRAPAASSRWRD
jgi:PAS domain S-box-containing protein